MSELITCPTCGAKVSSSARYCVECGEPDPWENCEEHKEKIRKEKEKKEKEEREKKLREESLREQEEYDKERRKEIAISALVEAHSHR